MPNKKNYDYIVPGYKFPVSNIECISNHYERRDELSKKLRHYVMVRCPFCSVEFEGRLDRLQFNPEKSEGPRTYCCKSCGQKHRRPYKDPWRDSENNHAEKQGINLNRVKQDFSGYNLIDSIILPASEGYTTSDGHARWKARCACGRTFFVDTGNITGSRSGYIKACCEVCSAAMSNGERVIENWLKNNTNLTFERQYVFKELRGLGDGVLRFDFAILKNDEVKYLIEFNGEQHYKFIEYFHHNIEQFKKQQEHDRRKRIYCKERHIILIEIPYNYNNLNDYLNKIEVK